MEKIVEKKKADGVGEGENICAGRLRRFVDDNFIELIQMRNKFLKLILYVGTAEDFIKDGKEKTLLQNTCIKYFEGVAEPLASKEADMNNKERLYYAQNTYDLINQEKYVGKSLDWKVDRIKSNIEWLDFVMESKSNVIRKEARALQNKGFVLLRDRLLPLSLYKKYVSDRKEEKAYYYKELR